MKRFFYITVLLLLLAAEAFATERYFTFDIESREELTTLTRMVSIDNVDNLRVYAYANDDQFAAFQKLGYTYEILPHPGTLTKPRMAAAAQAVATWDIYPTYQAYVAMMYAFADDYPDICAVVNAGFSVQGRDILFVRISDNVTVEEGEPEVLFTSTIHGDETAGYVLMLRLIDSLLAGYNSDPRITDMVNNMEIWINPLANPDGTYHSGNSTVVGATRGNANGVDLNRNFPDPDEGQHPDGKAWQPETEVMMDFAETHSIVLSANFHGGVEVVNYPWDTWSRRHPDDNWYQYVSHEYADTAQLYSPFGYMDYLNDGTTNGWDWYSISGGRQDFMNYWHGCRETTIELSNTKLVTESSLPSYWLYNRTSLLNYLEKARYGLRGVVTDFETGLPLSAFVKILNHDADSSEVRTDPEVGDYHRLLRTGTYDVQFIADGYISQTVTGVSLATDTSVVTLDIALVAVESDTDSDGILNNDDNCPTVYNPLQEDDDEDGFGNVCDNCSEIYNPEQVDFDSDGEGDACECCVGLTGNVNCDEEDVVDISDITFLIDNLYLSHRPLCCLEETNSSGDEEKIIDITDITALIAYLYISHDPLPACQSQPQ